MIRAIVFSLFLLLGWCAAASAATCYWVGGTANYDSSNVASWSSSTGGSGSTCAATGGIPKNSGDIAKFDGASGGGIVTVCGAAAANCPSGMSSLNLVSNSSNIDLTGFTGTLDFSAASASGLAVTAGSFTWGGTGAHTLKCGNASFTVVGGNGTVWDANNASLTVNCGSETVTFASISGAAKTAHMGSGFSWGSYTFKGAGGGALSFLTASGNATIATLVVSTADGPNRFQVRRLSGTPTFTITNAINWTGTSSNLITMTSDSVGTQAALAVAGGSAISWANCIDISFSASVTPSNTFVNNCTNLAGVAPAGGSIGIIGQ